MDSNAVYFAPENFNIKADGSMDVSYALQQALYDLKTTHNFEIPSVLYQLFIFYADILRPSRK